MNSEPERARAKAPGGEAEGENAAAAENGGAIVAESRGGKAVRSAGQVVGNGHAGAIRPIGVGDKARGDGASTNEECR